MLVDLPHPDRPSLHRVALLAVCPKLPLMNIRMAICASLSNVGEDRLHVALGASHVLVQAA